MNQERIVIVGGGAAGFFAAITCAEENPRAEIVLLEKTSHFLSKVKISGGGRCNVTHACFNEREFAERFPRGERELIGPLKQFQASDTVAWFTDRGVRLKTESDGRMFPTTDSSQTIIDCLMGAAQAAGVVLKTDCGVVAITKNADGRFELTLTDGARLVCDKVLLATGGCRTPALGQLAVSLGHTLEPPVPSLFTFRIDAPWLRSLAGITANVDATIEIASEHLTEHGPLLVTHWGLSGPVILRLSAWGARALSTLNYEFPLVINWMPRGRVDIFAELSEHRQTYPAKRAAKTPGVPFPARLWEQLVLQAGIPGEKRWADVSRTEIHRLTQQLTRTEFQVTGKSLNKDEFVTCGGVRLSEVNFKTMESRVCPGLFFAGELLNIDGITGGFNFQAAWTTGWIAGRAMASAAR